MDLKNLIKRISKPEKEFEKWKNENDIALKTDSQSSTKTCCFTGHRKLETSEKEIKAKTLAMVLKLIVEKGYTHFICGGAIGFDMLAAEIILELKKKFDVTLEIAIPCPEQDKYWSDEQKQKYEQILKVADKKTIVSNLYASNCMQQRNEYMVDNSSLVIAYFYKGAGGTKNTINYAKIKNVNILYILHDL